jgi:hypothetical protein
MWEQGSGRMLEKGTVRVFENWALGKYLRTGYWENI